jgi:hypothetical protein
MLTEADREFISEHIKGNRDQIMNELNELKWSNSMDESKIESLAPGVSKLIYDYVVAADPHE